VTRAAVRASAAASVTRKAQSPERGKSEKAIAAEAADREAEAEIERINGIIAKIDTALALPDLFHARSQAGRPAQQGAPARSALRRAEENLLEASSQFDEAAG